MKFSRTSKASDLCIRERNFPQPKHGRSKNRPCQNYYDYKPPDSAKPPVRAKTPVTAKSTRDHNVQSTFHVPPARFMAFFAASYGDVLHLYPVVRQRLKLISLASCLVDDFAQSGSVVLRNAVKQNDRPVVKPVGHGFDRIVLALYFVNVPVIVGNRPEHTHISERRHKIQGVLGVLAGRKTEILRRIAEVLPQIVFGRFDFIHHFFTAD